MLIRAAERRSFHAEPDRSSAAGMMSLVGCYAATLGGGPEQPVAKECEVRNCRRASERRDHRGWVSHPVLAASPKEVGLGKMATEVRSYLEFQLYEASGGCVKLTSQIRPQLTHYRDGGSPAGASSMLMPESATSFAGEAIRARPDTSR